MNKRIQWNGKTHPVAFVFNFIGDEDPADITLPAYRKYEEKHPGKITELTELYWNDTDAWLENEIDLNKEQIETLQALLDCVNDWHIQEYEFFSALIAPELRKEKINNWSSDDSEGLRKYKSAMDWWDESKNSDYIIADVQDRISDALGEDSYLFEYFCSGDLTELFDNLFTFFCNPAPYDYENLGFTDEDEEIAVPDEEMEDLDKFLASNVLLIDLKNASNRYHRNLK
jgi:hypothetical protein